MCRSDQGPRERLLVQVLDVTSRYNRFEAWAYDRSTAPALADWVRENVLESVLDEVPDSGSVLDVGCGGGQVALALEEMRPDLSVVGLDLSRDLIRWAVDRAEGAGDSISFLRGDALGLPFRTNTFDLVLSVGSLKHWPDREKGIGECVRVLKPDGLLRVLEADRDTTWSEAWTFSGRLNVPFFARPMFSPYFKTVVAGGSLTLGETRKVLSAVDLDRYEVDSLEEIPLLQVRGRG